MNIINNKNKNRIEYLSKSDSTGKSMFFLYWYANYHPGHPKGEYQYLERGQIFMSDPRNYGFPRPEELKLQS